MAVNLIVTYGLMFLWITLSAAVILVNKYILSMSGFPYPVALTCLHMAFCSTLAWLIVKLGYADAVHIERQTYLSSVVPIGGLFAGTLWLGNAAYLYLSVSFIQMIKATMPMNVYAVGCLLGTEIFSVESSANMFVVVAGIALASYGEVLFHLLGFTYQVVSLATESTRLTLIQILLQRRGIKMNPISTLYHIAPVSLAFLLIPFFSLELTRMRDDPQLVVNVPVLLASCLLAFFLNLSVFLLIGKTSALTMNVAGVVKDWLLIGLSVFLFASPVTRLQLVGYSIAFSGVAFYNYKKIQQMKQEQAVPRVLLDKAQKVLATEEEATALIQTGSPSTRDDDV